MTTTNRAFIKAYRTDQAQVAPASPTFAGAGRPPAAAQPAVTEQAAAASAPSSSSERSALYGPRTTSEPSTVLRGSRDPKVVLGSHDPAVGTSDGLRYRADRSQHGGGANRPHPSPLPEKEGGNLGKKRPLSSFIASTGIARLDSEPVEGDFFRPGTTVASFHWPEVCRTLMRTCSDPLAQVADLLVTHAAAGRSLVAIVAMAPGDGATTTTICLASKLAERHRRVIIVDGNFRKPGLAKRLDVEPTAGWQDVLKHGAPLTDAVVRATDDRLDLLALGEKIPNDASRLVSGLQAVVTAGVLRHAYDHVLLDAGAFVDPTCQPLLLELMRNMGIDAAIAVTGGGRTPPSDISALADHLSRSGCEFLGTIANRIAKPQAA